MNLPNNFKILWWLALTGLLTWFLYQRYPAFEVGHTGPADIVVFTVWLALLLAPLFQEISLMGFTLKQEIDGLKEFISTQISLIQADLHNAVDVQTHFSPQITLPTPLDSQLPALEEKIEQAVNRALKTHRPKINEIPKELSVDSNVSLLFSTRYNIEKELQRLFRVHGLEQPNRRVTAMYVISRALVNAEIIEPDIEHAIREVYSVCSPAIHGGEITKAQIDFVKEVGSKLVGVLRSIS